MSTTTVIQHPTGTETYGQKVWRKLKEEPLIPAFAALTCLALVQASRKMNKGDQQSMNRWLRFRVVAQGATIVALLGYSYAYGFSKRNAEGNREGGIRGLMGSGTGGMYNDVERRKLNSERERERFETRMKEVEEMHRVESEGMNRTEEQPQSQSQQKRMDGMLGVDSNPTQNSSQSQERRSSWFSWGRKRDS